MLKTKTTRGIMDLKQEKIPTNWKDIVTKLFLERITSKGNYNRAVQIADKLVGRTDLSRDQVVYLDILSVLIEDYENRSIEFDENQNPNEILKFLLQSNGLNGSDLGRILGQRQLGSKILNGTRQLSKKHIKILAAHFSVSPALFI